MEKEESGFKVADRRLFTADGDLRDKEPAEPGVDRWSHTHFERFAGTGIASRGRHADDV